MDTKDFKPGLYWHVHHEILFEYCHSYEERAKYIREQKPGYEVATRLRLFKPIVGVLGNSKADAEYRKAYAEYRKADDECRKAGAKWSKAYAKWSKAYAECNKAYAEWSKAYDEWSATSTDKDVQLLHKQECKNCPWDGHTIFPNK